MTTFLSNAFSLSMVEARDCELLVGALSPEEVRTKLSGGFISSVGHQTTADLLTEQLGIGVTLNRMDIRLQKYDQLIVAQYSGPRLPEGTCVLPEGARIDFKLVKIKDLKG